MADFNLLNFKSVMLSDRPPVAGGLGAASSGAKKGGPTPFNSMVRMRDSVGLVPAKDRTIRHAAELNPEGIQIRKDNDVIARHKRWLKEQQRMIADAKDRELREVLEMEEKNRLFKENQKAKRELLRLNREAIDAAGRDDAEMYENAEEAAVTQSFPGKYSVHHTSSNNHHHHSIENRNVQHGHQRVIKHGRRKNVPKWAMTEQAAEGVDEDEVEDLLDFADNLDFEAYMGDYEVRQALSLVKSRIKQLESRQVDLHKAESQIEEYYEEVADDEEEVPGVEYITEETDDGRLRKLKKVRRVVHAGRRYEAADEDELKVLEQGWDSNTNVHVAGKDQRDLADRLLHTSHSLRGVHSAASLRNVVNRTFREVPTNHNPPAPPPLPPMKRVAVEIVRTSEPTLRRTVDPSNLPYLYRNPAV